jgi:hypothetical protein
LNPSILKTERPPVIRVRSNSYCGSNGTPDRAASALPRERVRSLTQRGQHRKGQPAGGMDYCRRPDRSATLYFSPANFPPAAMLLQNHQTLFRSKPKNTLVSLHSK